MTSSNQSNDASNHFDLADKNDFQARYWIPTVWIENLGGDLGIDSAQKLVDYTVSKIKPEACCTRFERCPTSGKLHAHLFIQMDKTVRLWTKLTKAFGAGGIHVLYARRDGENAKSYSVKDETSEGEPAFFNIDPESIKPWGVHGGKTGKQQKGGVCKKPSLSFAEKEKKWADHAEQLSGREVALDKLVREVCSKRYGPNDKFNIYAIIKLEDPKAEAKELERQAILQMEASK